MSFLNPHSNSPNAATGSSSLAIFQFLGLYHPASTPRWSFRISVIHQLLHIRNCSIHDPVPSSGNSQGRRLSCCLTIPRAVDDRSRFCLSPTYHRLFLAPPSAPSWDKAFSRKFAAMDEDHPLGSAARNQKFADSPVKQAVIRTLGPTHGGSCQKPRRGNLDAASKCSLSPRFKLSGIIRELGSGMRPS